LGVFDDSGCPHTLEHLIFHGSEQYPFSDALQRIASRYFSATPNAWTATDSTVYTISSAGEDSFLHLLPVYVDHILYPRLEESTFTTEVFHINEKGQDAGVVYSEMQGRQHTAPDLIDLACVNALVPNITFSRP
jgi:Zn-dependent M16 (insulinase) family peptidase